MNAYQIMGFLLLFNFSISLVGGLSIYEVGSVTQPSDDYNIMNYSELGTESAKNALLERFFISISFSLIGGIVLGSMVSIFTNVPSDSAFVYSIFSTSYWTFAGNSILVIWGFTETGNSEVYTAIFGLVAIFTVIMAISFISFYMQLVKGPWAGMK